MVLLGPHHPRICKRYLGRPLKPSRTAIEALLEGRHADPFALLGSHAGPKGTFARVWIPGAETAEAHTLSGQSVGTLKQIDKRGLFEGIITGPPTPLKYKAQA